MSEYIISEDCAKNIQKRAWHAGRSNIEPYTLELPDGSEIIRCRDCRESREKGWKCTRFSEEIYDEAQEVGELVMANTRPDGYCFWAEKRES